MLLNTLVCFDMLSVCRFDDHILVNSRMDTCLNSIALREQRQWNKFDSIYLGNNIRSLQVSSILLSNNWAFFLEVSL